MLLGRKVMTNPDSILKGRDITLPNKGPASQNYGFSHSHVWMWELDYKESSAPKNRCFWTVALEKTLEHPLDSKEIHPVHPKGNQSWVFIGRTDAEAPTLWPPDVKSWLIAKDPDSGKEWRWEEKGMTEDETVGRHHWLNGYEWVNSGSWWWTGRPGVLQSMGSQESDTTEQLNWLTDWVCVVDSALHGWVCPQATREARLRLAWWVQGAPSRQSLVCPDLPSWVSELLCYLILPVFIRAF